MLFAHSGITKPDPPPPGPGLALLALQQELANLLLTLELENYEVPAPARTAAQEASEAARALPPDAAPQERAALLARFGQALDGLLRFDETTELRCEEGKLSLFRPPKRFNLLANVSRLIPVILTNDCPHPVSLAWQAQVSGQVQVQPGGKVRFFVPLRAGPRAKRAAIRFHSAEGRVEAQAPVALRPSGRLSVRVLEENGKLTPARLYVTGSDGRSYAPEGATKRLTDMGERYYHVPGEFTLVLPEGEAKLEFIKGFEYELKTLALPVKPAATIRRTVRLQRWVDLPARGWFSGDGHIHMHYGGSLKVTPEEVMLMLQAEDLNIGNMVVANIWGDDIQDRQHFEAATNRLSLPRHIMRWNEEYRNNFLGHLILYNLKELADPIYSGFVNTPHPFDYPLNADICDQALAAGGFATGAHPAWGRAEHAIDVALGKLGGIETAGYGAFFPAGVQVLHALWNCGFHTVATAGTDSFLNVVQRDPLGGARCYARVDGPLSYESWVEAMEAGRTFVSTAPMLFLQVNGQAQGADLRLTGEQARRLEVRARASSQWPLSDLQVFYNGEVIGRVKASSDQRELVFEGEIEARDSGWIAATCTGPHNRFIMGGSLFKRHAQFAHTSPVWLTVDGKPQPPSRDAARFVAWTDDFTKTVIEQGKFENDQQRERARELFGQARARFAELAEQHRASVQPKLLRRWKDEAGRQIEQFLLEGEEPIPFVVMSDGRPGPKPVAFWQHGATGHKLANLDPMHRLCDAGYLVASLDQRLHGERAAKMPPLASGRQPAFRDTAIYIACGTAQDARRVIDYLETRPDVIPDRIGWSGGSLGGLVGAILATTEKRVKAVVSLIGSGAHRQLAEAWGKKEDPWEPETEALLRRYDPLERVDAMFPAAVLLYNGATDGAIPVSSAQAFCDAARPYYQQRPDRLKLIINPNSGHEIPEEGMAMMLDWFKRFL
jgi:dienelactone hydrolase